MKQNNERRCRQAAQIQKRALPYSHSQTRASRIVTGKVTTSVMCGLANQQSAFSIGTRLGEQSRRSPPTCIRRPPQTVLCPSASRCPPVIRGELSQEVSSEVQLDHEHLQLVPDSGLRTVRLDARCSSAEETVATKVPRPSHAQRIDGVAMSSESGHGKRVPTQT